MIKKRLFIAIFLLLLTFLAFYYSDYTLQQFRVTLTMIVKIIIPSLTPFMILIQFLVLYQAIDVLGFVLQYLSYPLFKISGYGAIIVLTAIFGGFPYSAIMAHECLKLKQIELQEAKRIVKYIFFPSLAFMLSTLLNIHIENQKIFHIITFCVYFSGFILLFFSRNSKTKATYFQKNELKMKLNQPLKNDLSQSFIHISKNVGLSLLSISFSILVFSMLKNYLQLFFTGKLLNFVAGLFEFSGASIAILSQKHLLFLDYVLLTFILTFSGFSVFFQALPYLKEMGIGFKQLFFSRLLCASLSVGLFSLIFLFLF